jgi:hypothetical protein
MAGERFIRMLSQGSQSGPEAFHAPAAKTANQEIRKETFFHKDSICRWIFPIRRKDIF